MSLLFPAPNKYLKLDWLPDFIPLPFHKQDYRAQAFGIGDSGPLLKYLCLRIANKQ
jgi:hypothetical protein